MRHRSGWRVWRAVLAFAVVLALGGGGCGRDQALVTWTASGTRVTRLDMPLDHAHSFMVGEYVLEGREGSGPGARAFRDRLLLTAHRRGDEGHVWGYGTRTYADGATQSFGLSGMVRAVGRDPEVMAMTGWVQFIGPDGLVTYRPRAWVELRLDPANGRISVEAS